MENFHCAHITHTGSRGRVDNTGECRGECRLLARVSGEYCVVAGSGATLGSGITRSEAYRLREILLDRGHRHVRVTRDPAELARALEKRRDNLVGRVWRD